MGWRGVAWSGAWQGGVAECGLAAECLSVGASRRDGSWSLEERGGC